MKPHCSVPCRGRSPKTGKRVGTRHRWNGGATCEFCGRYKSDVFRTAPATIKLPIDK